MINKLDYSKRIDFINGPLVKNVLLFAFPLMITTLLQMLFNAADTIVVGQFVSQNALAAVGATGSLIYLITSLFTGLGVGVNVVVSNAIGANDEGKIKYSIDASIILAIIGGIILTIVGILFSNKLLRMMATPIEIISQSTLYMQIIFIGAIPNLLYIFASSILRANGDTTRPMYYLLFAGLVNVILNCIMTIVFKFGIAGVAIATVVSQIISCILTINALIKGDRLIKLNIKSLSFDLKMTIEIIRIGVPAGIQGMVFSISNVAVQRAINSFNSATIIAADTAAANIERFLAIGMQAFSQSTMTFTSQRVGAKKIDGIKRVLLVTLVLNALTTFLIGINLWYFGEYFLALFSDDKSVITNGLIRLFWIAPFLTINSVSDTLVNSMRGMKYSLFPTILMLFSICGFRLLWIDTYFKTHHTLNALYVCYPLSWLCSMILELILWIYLFNKFKHKKG